MNLDFTNLNAELKVVLAKYNIRLTESTIHIAESTSFGGTGLIPAFENDGGIEFKFLGRSA